MLSDMHDAAQNSKTKSKSGYASDIASVYWRMVATDELSVGVARQRASDLRLFSLVTGIVDVTAIEQFHLSQYRDALAKVPKNFLRSDKDQDLTIKALMARSELNPPSDNGLSPSTMRRHLKSVELLLKRAKSEGHEQTIDLDVTLLKPKTKANTPAHKRRAVFKFDELQQVFSHSAWQGCLSEGRRHLSGNKIIKDSRYWVPLILAYTGARRAEVSGLLANDVETIDGIPCFHIRSNQYRGIKGENEAEGAEKNRIIPIHPHLIELGLLDQANSQSNAAPELLFPDILPKARYKTRDTKQTKPGKIGDSLDDFWRKSLRLALDGNPRKLCMHSLRHYVNHQLIHQQAIHEVTRFDLLGHVESGDAAQSINTSTYRDETGVSEKYAAIASLPSLF
jgi:integrase